MAGKQAKTLSEYQLVEAAFQRRESDMDASLRKMWQQLEGSDFLGTQVPWEDLLAKASEALRNQNPIFRNLLSLGKQEKCG